MQIRFKAENGILYAHYPDGTVADHGSAIAPTKSVMAWAPDDGRSMQERLVISTITDEVWAQLSAHMRAINYWPDGM